MRDSITVCLLTCDRSDYTRVTLSSFLEHNDLSRFRLIHGDDASEGKRNLRYAAQHGFETVEHTRERIGGQEMRRRLVMRAAAMSDWVLILENDWEWVRAFPWRLFDYLRASRPDVYALRLFGEFKERDQKRKAGTRHRGKDNLPAGWTQDPAAPEPCEIGTIHWGAPPCVTRASDLVWLHQNCRKESDSIRRSGLIDSLTARTPENVVFHIGAQRTPKFKH